jgi:hypothetical protein
LLVAVVVAAIVRAVVLVAALALVDTALQQV